MLTDLIKHLVTFVEHESLNIAQGEVLVTDESVEATGSTDNDVGEGLLVLEKLDVLLYRGTAIEDRGLHVWQILAESRVLVLDLVGEFSSVAHDQHRGFSRNGFQLVQSGQDEDRSLTETGLGLTKNVDTEESLWNTLLLDCRRSMMLDFVR